MEVKQMRINSFKMEPEGEKTVALFDLVTRYLRDELLLPPHQRDRVWDEDKKLGWIHRLQSDLSPIGVIVTYQLKGSTPIYINDGFQRISTSSEYLSRPEMYGDTSEGSIINLRAINMPVQHRHYNSHDQAVIDFQQINMGTHLTTYEYCKGILTYIDSYDLYEESLNQIIKVLEAAEVRLANKRIKSRTKEHKMYRNSYAIFYRYITRDTKLSAYLDIPKTQIKQSLVSAKKNIEWKLRTEIEKINDHTIFVNEVNKFSGFIEREVATIEEIWYREFGKVDGLNPTLLRWLLDVAVWKRNNGIAIIKHKEFTKKLLEHTQGKSYIVVLDEKNKPLYNITLSLSKLHGLKSICEQIGSEDITETAKRRKRPKKRGGYDNSHIKAFSIFGEGDTFAEPGNINRARGAKPIE